MPALCEVRSGRRAKRLAVRRLCSGRWLKPKTLLRAFLACSKWGGRGGAGGTWGSATVVRALFEGRRMCSEVTVIRCGQMPSKVRSQASFFEGCNTPSQVRQGDDSRLCVNRLAPSRCGGRGDIRCLNPQSVGNCSYGRIGSLSQGLARAANTTIVNSNCPRISEWRVCLMGQDVGQRRPAAGNSVVGTKK